MEQMAQEFWEKVTERHETGEKEYGHLTWLTADTIEMHIEELADIVNYSAFTAVKLMILREKMRIAAAKLPDATDEGDGMVTTGLGDIDR